MKAVCPICHRVGVVEQRGGSVRFVHYEYVDGKRIFTKHTIKNGNRMGTMGTALGTEKPNTSFFNQNLGGRRLAWSRLRDSDSRDPGSNPGGPTNRHLRFRYLPQNCLFED